MTRHWFSNREYLEKISLVLIDEVHLLTEKRGATLESIVSRMKTRNTLSSKVSSCRFITTSATMPNWHDIASWLGAPFGPAEALVFGEEYRPVPLQKFVYGYIHNQEKGGEFKFDNSLNYKLQEILNNHAEGRPTLVFCSTRKAAMQAAEFLARNMPKLTHSFHGKVKDRKLAELLSFGLAFHHAGLAFEDRLFVERSFIESKIQVLFSTSTLSVGVNLPAHLVIIKSTMRYVDRHFEEYSELDILQMMGRAGRPQVLTLFYWIYNNDSI